MLLGDISKAAFLTQAFDRGLPLPEERVELLFDLAGAERGAGRGRDGRPVQVCNCNGVSKGDLVACVRGGEHSVTGCMNATRAGKGCGSCKPLVAEIVEWAVAESGGEVGEDPSANWYVPGDPDGQGRADRRDPRAEPAVGVGGVRGAGADGEDAAARCRPGVAAEDGVERRVRRRARRALHQRPRARQHPARRHVLGGAADQGRGHHRRRAAADRRRRRQVRRADGQDHRRPAHRPARRAQGGPAGGLGGPRHALGLRLRQVASAREELRRHRLLPLRPRRLARRSAVAIEQTLPGPREPGQDEARGRRLPAQLLGGAGQGRRRGRRRRRPVGDLRRRRGRAHPCARATCWPPSTATTR